MKSNGQPFYRVSLSMRETGEEIVGIIAGAEKVGDAGSEVHVLVDLDEQLKTFQLPQVLLSLKETRKHSTPPRLLAFDSWKRR